MEKTIEQKLLELKKTIDFKWRVQSAYPKTNPTMVIMIPYIDARDVQDRLDEVIGASGWQNKFEDIGGKLHCSIGIKINDDWVWKSDRGTASQTEKEKGEASDAFKRAAVMWGINREAYQVGTVKLNCKEKDGKYYPSDDSGKFLKGEQLYKICNSLAKITDLDNYGIQITDTHFVEARFKDTDPVKYRIFKLIEDADTVEKLKKIEKNVTPELLDAYTFKLETLQANGSK